MDYGGIGQLQTGTIPVTRMLASVNSLSEAKIALDAGVDIIDLKDPAKGSLGALDVTLVREVVDYINGRCPTSATIGDLPMQPDVIVDAVQAMAKAGVNYVKIGFFPGGNETQVITKLKGLALRVDLIAVLFAENKPDLTLIDKLVSIGFKGVMLDTQDKSKGSLTSIMANTRIEQFVGQLNSRNVLSGLAGSLRFDDISRLLPYQPDYLGFRGALCNQCNRAGQINLQSVQMIKKAIIDYAP